MEYKSETRIQIIHCLHYINMSSTKVCLAAPTRTEKVALYCIETQFV